MEDWRIEIVETFKNTKSQYGCRLCQFYRKTYMSMKYFPWFGPSRPSRTLTSSAGFKGRYVNMSLFVHSCVVPCKWYLCKKWLIWKYWNNSNNWYNWYNWYNCNNRYMFTIFFVAKIWRNYAEMHSGRESQQLQKCLFVLVLNNNPEQTARSCDVSRRLCSFPQAGCFQTWQRWTMCLPVPHSVWYRALAKIQDSVAWMKSPLATQCQASSWRQHQLWS